MKAFYLIVLIALFNCSAYAQFPGKNVALFDGAEIKVKELEEVLKPYGYSGFYTTIDMKHTDIYKESRFKSKYESLVGKVFKVLEVTPYKIFSGETNYKIKIENPETGILYYDYSPEYESSFPFTFVSGLKLPAGFYCQQLEKVSEGGTVTVSSPIEDGITLIKVTKNKVSTIFIEVKAYGGSLSTGAKGLTITLENGKTVSKPAAKIDVEANTSGYTYSAFVSLTPAEVTMLLSSKITSAKLYVYDSTVNEGVKIQEYLKCLKK